MIIAVIISGMLMPAQIFAKNDKNEKNIENRINKDYNRAKPNNKKVVKHINKQQKHSVIKHHNNNHVVVHHHQPVHKVVHHVKCKPHVVHHHHCDNDLAQAAAVAIGVAGLISILAD